MLLEVENWESLASRLGINYNTIKTNCGTSSDHASCFRSRLVKMYCDTLEASYSMEMIADNIAQVLDEEMKKRRPASILRGLTFSGE